MKQVLSRKRNITYKEVLKILSVIFTHYLGIYLYIAALLGLYTIGGHSFFEKINSSNWLLLYPITFGPAISALMHIHYTMRGGGNMRGVMWLHTFAILIIVPIAIYA